MKKGIIKLKLTAVAGALSAAVLVMTPSVSAHVVVKPAEVAPAGYVTFAVSVPNERSVDTIEIKLLIPEGLQSVTPTVKPGWTIETESSEAAGEGGHSDTGVTEIVWAGGVIPEGQRDDFSFSAKAPAQAGELTWKAYQTYADGTVVSWDRTDDDQPKKADGSPDFSTYGPFSVTKVAEPSTPDATADTAASDKTARRALYASIAAAVVALLALVLASRPKQK